MTVYVTSNNALCVTTRETAETREVIHRPSGDEVLLGSEYDYVKVQMQPPVPQRFEWVRKDRLHKLGEVGK